MSDKLPGYGEAGMTNVAEPPPAIPASTVMLLRDTDAGMKVLMLKRNSKGAFGGYWVFPGGRVDDDDDDELAAAVREAKEESGLDLDPATFVRFSHWTPPPTEMKRFATWFFVAEAPGIEEDVTIDDGEIVDHAWVTPADMLAKRDAGEIELAPPTFITLTTLSESPNVATALETARSTTPPVYLTSLHRAEKRAFTLWEGDVAYEDSSLLFADGPRHRIEITTKPWVYERTI